MLKILVNLAIFLFSLSPQIASGQGQKKLLLIGNSFTYYNEMPITLQEMFDETNVDIKVSVMTHAGASLADHLTHSYHNDTGYSAASLHEIPQTITKILTDKWDYVVLQVRPFNILIPELRQLAFKPAVLMFDSLIKLQGAKTILFQSITLNKYPINYCIPGGKSGKSRNVIRTFILHSLPNDKLKEIYCSDTFHNSEEEFQIIKTTFDEIASNISADIIPVGEAFQKAKIQTLPFQCFSTHTNHPTEYGSYMIACLFYKYFTGRSVSQIKYHAKIENSNAEKIKKIVDELK